MSDADSISRITPHAQRLDRWILCVLSLIYFGVMAVEGTSVFLLPATIYRFTEDPFLIACILGLNPFFGLVAQPWAGYYSDGVWTRFGRRKPVLSVSVLLLMVGCVVIPFSPNIWTLMLAIAVYQASQDTNDVLRRCLIADTVPLEQTGTYMGMSEFLGRIGFWTAMVVGGATLARRAEWVWYLSLASIMAATVVPSLLTVNESYQPSGRKGPFQLKKWFRDLLGVQYFPRLCLVIVFYFISYNAITNFYTLFTMENLHLEPTVAVQAFSLYPIAALIIAVPAGWISDRIGKRYVIQAGVIFVFLAALMGMQVQTLLQLKVMAILTGLGVVLIELTMAAYLIGFMPRDKIGQFTGASNMFRGGPRLFLNVVVGYIIRLWGRNYRVAFVASAVTAVAAFTVLCTIPANQDRRSP